MANCCQSCNSSSPVENAIKTHQARTTPFSNREWNREGRYSRNVQAVSIPLLKHASASWSMVRIRLILGKRECYFSNLYEKWIRGRCIQTLFFITRTVVDFSFHSLVEVSSQYLWGKMDPCGIVSSTHSWFGLASSVFKLTLLYIKSKN